jgi:hypothetical protein
VSILFGPFLVLSTHVVSIGVNQVAFPTTHPLAVVTPTTGTGIYGLAGGAAGRLWWALYGSGGAGNVLNFGQEDGAAAAADRIASSSTSMNNIGGVRLGIMHAYDSTSQRWRRIA